LRQPGQRNAGGRHQCNFQFRHERFLTGCWLVDRQKVSHRGYIVNQPEGAI
jgi:hypothetical protein